LRLLQDEYIDLQEYEDIVDETLKSLESMEILEEMTD
jgi:hypothetical protein